MQPQTMLLADGTTRTLVHFAVRADADAGGVQRGSSRFTIACSPGLVELGALATREEVYHRSDDVRAVTCPRCQDTEIYQRARAELSAALALGRAAV